MTGIVDFRTELLDENGDPITNANPLPVSGGGGGGGSALADVLLTDDTGAVFVARDTGTAITYFNLNTNSSYTPTGFIQAAGLTNSQLRAAPLAVTDENNALMLVRLLNILNAPQGYDKSLQRARVTAILESGTVTTVTTVTTVAAVTSVNNYDGYNARMTVLDNNRVAWAQCVRARIT